VSNNSKPSLLVILSRFPYPLEKGDKLRAYHQLLGLSKQFEIILICTTDQPINQDHYQKVQSICTEIHVFKLNKIVQFIQLVSCLFTKNPFQIGYFYQPKIASKIKRIILERKPQNIYCQLIRVSEYVKHFHFCPKTLDYMDSFSKGLYRRAQKSKGIMKQIYLIEARKVEMYERQVFEYFESHTIISKQDSEFINHPKNKTIQIIKNGVSESFFESIELPKKYDLLFTGNMNYAPNIEAAIFLKQIVQNPNLSKINCLISGVNPHNSITKLASENYVVSGWVEDIRNSYVSSKIFVAPMFLGTGLQNKLLEAMAMGIPCVTTSLANKSLLAKPEEEILIAETLEEFICQIDRLNTDQALYNKIKLNARNYVDKHYSWKQSNDLLLQIISSNGF